MFSFLQANPTKKLYKSYRAILKEAMDAQRNGDIEGYAKLSAEAEKVFAEIQTIENNNSKA